LAEFVVGKLEAMPKDGKPISKWPNVHDALLEVARGVRAVAEEFGSTRQANSKAAHIEPVNLASQVNDIRSSNLRIKKTFTQREKDKFEREAYEYIEKYFENSLAELQYERKVEKYAALVDSLQGFYVDANPDEARQLKARFIVPTM
jgi:hypothetical protein